MLSKDNRLKHNKDFIRVFKKGKRHYISGVLLSFVSNDQITSRIGFVISKKYSNLAVRRNAQRRILQAAMTNINPEIKPGFDIVISYTNRDKMLSYKDAVTILTKLFNTANLY